MQKSKAIGIILGVLASPIFLLKLLNYLCLNHWNWFQPIYNFFQFAGRTTEGEYATLPINFPSYFGTFFVMFVVCVIVILGMKVYLGLTGQLGDDEKVVCDNPFCKCPHCEDKSLNKG